MSLINKKLILCILVTVVATLSMMFYFIKPMQSEATVETIKIKWNSNKAAETTTDYTVSFQTAIREIEEIPDTYADTDGFNGIYIETDDSTLTNYAAPKINITNNVSKSLLDLISMSDTDMWKYITDNYLSAYPTQSFSELESLLSALYKNYSTTIRVKIWYWENANDQTNFNKITKEINFTVNKKISILFEKAFEDLYNQPSKPVINVKDTGMGTWSIRGKNHNPNHTPSAHSLGTAIDINPSTGSFNINGIWYGNAYGQKVMNYSLWSSLPECHEKYQVIYEDSPIVQVFKSYGFVWGGDWNTKDNMHFSFLGDSTGRETGYTNYIEYRRK